MDAPLRFCFCTTFYPPHSGDADGEYVYRLANALALRGHSVTVVHNPGAFKTLKGKQVAEPHADPPNLVVRPVSAPLGGLGLLAIHQTGRPVGIGAQLERAMQGPFDVIHFHNVSLMGGPAVYGYGTSTVKIGSLNDHWLVCPMHLLWKYTGEVCERPQCFTCSIRQGRPPQLWRRADLMTEMSKPVDVFLGPSVFTIRKHLERGFRRPMIHLPPLHQSSGQAGSFPGAERPDRPYFLCVGRLEDYKGFQDVIPEFAQFSDHDLIVCGEGSFRQRLHLLAAELSNVRLASRPLQEALHALYLGAVATIVPSRCVQTFCHVTAESWSAGTPVIAFRRSAVEEMVSEHGGGILYTRPDELRQAIANLIHDARVRQVLQAQARNAFEQEFSEAAYLQRYLQIIGELLAQKRQQGSLSRILGSSQVFAGRRIFNG